MKLRESKNTIRRSSSIAEQKEHRYNNNMNTELETLIANSKGRFFSITFKKKDGSIRTINGKNKYLAYLRGGESYGRAAGYVPFIDRNKKNWASAHKDAVLSFKCGEIEKTFSV